MIWNNIYCLTQKIIFMNAAWLFRLSRPCRIICIFCLTHRRRSIWLTDGVIFSQRFMLKLVEKGWSREKAYDTVQPKAIEAWTKHVSFRKLMEETPEVTAALSPEEIDDCFDTRYHIRNVDEVFRRVGLL